MKDKEFEKMNISHQKHKASIQKLWVRKKKESSSPWEPLSAAPNDRPEMKKMFHDAIESGSMFMKNK
jgi:hypothetical protein